MAEPFVLIQMKAAPEAAFNRMPLTGECQHEVTGAMDGQGRSGSRGSQGKSSAESRNSRCAGHGEDDDNNDNDDDDNDDDSPPIVVGGDQ